MVTKTAQTATLSLSHFSVAIRGRECCEKNESQKTKRRWLTEEKEKESENYYFGDQGMREGRSSTEPTAGNRER